MLAVKICLCVHPSDGLGVVWGGGEVVVGVCFMESL